MYSNYMYALVPIITMQLLSFDTQIQLLQVKHFIITHNYHMYLEEQFCKNSPLFDEWGLI